MVDTVWVLGDQLNRDLAHLRDTTPGDTRVLMVLSLAKLRSKPWHRQRAHLIVTAMRRFADELRDRGYEVDWREADTFAQAHADHVAAFSPDVVRAMEPMNRTGRRVLLDLGVELVRSDAFLTHPDEFRAWADDNGRSDGSLLMEDFYRWQRRRLDVLVDAEGDPVGGRWNFDEDNREPPPGDGHDWPEPVVSSLDDLDRDVMAQLESMDGVELIGEPPSGVWPTTRRRALARLDAFIDRALAGFGPYEDAVVSDHWHLNHSMMSVPLNLGLVHPGEVVERVVDAFHERAGTDHEVPINSVEGFVRQVIGWREYVHGLYWLYDEDYASSNELGAGRDLPPVFTDPDVDTQMVCVSRTLGWVREYGWTHHIPRLMVVANLATLAGIDPQQLTDWMWRSYVDGAEWVMVPNVVGMGTFADGGTMSTKPYVSGGNYISRMTDFCGDCRFRKSDRVGEDACPFTTLYWDFLDRHEDLLRGNHRMARTYSTLDRLSDLDEVRTRARSVLSRLSAGTL